MAIQNPIVAEIAWRTWCIDEYGMDAQFLLEGEEKSLLIDSGTGACDLPSIVKELTDKPVMVALTHGHVDHAGGMNLFPEVYLHPDDFSMAESVDVKARKQYVATMMEMSHGIYAMTPDHVICSNKIAKLLPLTEGAVIHLGGRDIEVIETPGHTPGGLSFLDKKQRIMFNGDACNMNTLLAVNEQGVKRTNISDLLYTAEKLKSFSLFYDRIYNGHIGYADMVNIMPMPEGLIQDCIDLCHDLLSGNKKGTPDSNNAFMGSCLVARNRTMQILYREDQLK